VKKSTFFLTFTINIIYISYIYIYFLFNVNNFFFVIILNISIIIIYNFIKHKRLKEYYQAFTSKPRIARTPVESISLTSISTNSKTTLPEIRPNSSSVNRS